MKRRYSSDDSGWRGIGQLAKSMKASPSSMYGRHGGMSPELGELVRKGLVETRVFRGERGRGGEVTRLRIAYDRDPVKEYVKEQIASTSEEETAHRVFLPKNRLAVIPFVNMSPDPKDEFFADGLTEELIDRISQIKELEVIARTSIMTYKKQGKKAAEIGKELWAGSLVEGSVRRSANRIRVTAQLIDANSEGSLWSSKYDSELQDIFDVQGDIAEQVAEALRVQLLPNERSAIQEKATGNLEAYALYLRAKQLFHENDELSLRGACALFEEVVSKDPSFSRAYVDLAHALRGLAMYEDYAVTAAKAAVAAKKALELVPRSAEAHAAMAAAHLSMDKFEEAHRELEIATHINPNLSEVNALLGEVNCTFGRFNEGIAQSQKALALDPLSANKAQFLSLALRVAGRVDEAIALLHGMVKLHADNHRVYFSMALCHLQRKEFSRATEAIELGLRLSSRDPELLTAQGMLYGMTGRRKEAEDVLRAMSTADKALLEWAQLCIRASLGDLDEAFEALMQEAEDHSWYNLIAFDPLSEVLRDDPRFSKFCVRVGLFP